MFIFLFKKAEFNRKNIFKMKGVIVKKLAVFAAILIVLSFFVVTNIAVALPGQADPPCGRPLIEGCIGACGAPFLVSYRVLESGAYCFTTTGSSLCPNTGAEVSIYLNRELRFKKDMTNGVFLVVGAREGDIITIEANLFPIDNGIVCIWLGELYFKLGRLGNKGHM
ncbi:MAG: hypothetical protein ACMUIU_14400 [bacterium]